jgi:hypothetical protein
VVAANLVERMAQSTRLASELQWLRKSATTRASHTPFGDESVECIARGRGRSQLGDRPVPVGHDKPLSTAHEVQVLAEVLSQLGDADGRHVHKGSMMPAQWAGLPISSDRGDSRLIMLTRRRV